MGNKSLPLLPLLTRRIVKEVAPDKIVLFGSRARGDGSERSDYDILVVMPSDKPRYRRAGPLYRALNDLQVPIDIVVWTPEEVEEWKNVRQAFITTALREGKVLYEKSH